MDAGLQVLAIIPIALFDIDIFFRAMKLMKGD
jgi:hypothetical protein